MDVVAAASYASGNSKFCCIQSRVDLTSSIENSKEGFRGLWRRVKPPEKPDEVRCDLSFLLGLDSQ